MCSWSVQPILPRRCPQFTSQEYDQFEWSCLVLFFSTVLYLNSKIHVTYANQVEGSIDAKTGGAGALETTEMRVLSWMKGVTL